jgi:hypothetical protein
MYVKILPDYRPMLFFSHATVLAFVIVSLPYPISVFLPPSNIDRRDVLHVLRECNGVMALDILLALHHNPSN